MTSQLSKDLGRFKKTRWLEVRKERVQLQGCFYLSSDDRWQKAFKPGRIMARHLGTQKCKHKLPPNKYEITRCFHDKFVTLEEAPSSWKIVILVFLRKPRDGVGDVEVSRDLKTSLTGKRTRTRRLEAVARERHRRHQLSAPSRTSDATAAEPFGVAGGQKDERVARQREKTYGVHRQRGHQARRLSMWQDQLIFRKLCVIKTLTDGLQASLWEMAGLEGQATFEHVECKFQFTRCTRQGSVGAPTLWLKLAMQILWSV